MKSQTKRHFIALEKLKAGNTLVGSEMLRFSLIIYLNFFGHLVPVSDNSSGILLQDMFTAKIHCQKHFLIAETTVNFFPAFAGHFFTIFKTIVETSLSAVKG